MCGIFLGPVLCGELHFLKCLENPNSIQNQGFLGVRRWFPFRYDKICIQRLHKRVWRRQLTHVPHHHDVQALPQAREFQTLLYFVEHLCMRHTGFVN